MFSCFTLIFVLICIIFLKKHAFLKKKLEFYSGFYSQLASISVKISIFIRTLFISILKKFKFSYVFERIQVSWEEYRGHHGCCIRQRTNPSSKIRFIKSNEKILSF